MGRSFNGSSQYFTSTLELSPQTNWTICYWCKRGNTAYEAIMGRRNPTGAGNGFLLQSSDSRINITYLGGDSYGMVSDVDMVIPTWTHVAFIKSGSAGKFRLGGTDYATATIGTMTNPTGTPGLYIAAYNNGGTPGLFYTGNLAEVAVWNAALSDANIDDMRAGGAGGIGKSADHYDTDLVYYWKLDETSGDAAATVGGVTLSAVAAPGNVTHPSMEYPAAEGALIAAIAHLNQAPVPHGISY